MTRLVVDASVVVKWLLPHREGERDVARAVALFEGVRRRRVDLVQPAHWLAEVAAVLARLSPHTAVADVEDLLSMELEVEAGPEVYATAVQLACALPHHLFDTLYHAVALVTPGARLVTADERYHAKAHGQGSIVLLRDLELHGEPGMASARE